MISYKTLCDKCEKKFSTTTALLKHRTSKHVTARRVKQLPFYMGEIMVSVPKPYSGSPSEDLFQSYKLWLSGVAESVNSTLHPKVSGECQYAFIKRLFKPR